MRIRKLKHRKASPWAVTYYDGQGVRLQRSFVSRVEAENFILKQRERDKAQKGLSADLVPTITLSDYSERWLAILSTRIRGRTIDGYRKILKDHVLPTLGRRPVAEIGRSEVYALVAKVQGTDLARNTVRNVHAVLRNLLNFAVDESLLASNPALQVARRLRLHERPRERQEKIKAFDREQVEGFMEAAWKHEGRFAPLFLTLARAGLRLGEALALKWEDLDFGKRTLRIERSLSGRGTIDKPKSGFGRTVDMSQELRDGLERLRVQRKRETLKNGWPQVPEWVFCTEAGTAFDQSNVRRTFGRVLAKAKLPGHFHPHCMRHTFASLLLQGGVSPVYVQRQLGHASFQLTVDTYGKWLPQEDKQAVDSLDGDKVEQCFEKTANVSANASRNHWGNSETPTNRKFPRRSATQRTRSRKSMEPPAGIEPATYGLRNRCSTN